MTTIILGFFFVGIIAIIFYTPHQMYCGIKRIQYGTLSLKEKFISWIPVYNVINAEHSYLGSNKVLINSICIVVSLVFRFIVIFKFTENRILNILTVIFLLVSLIAWFLVNIIFVYIVLGDTDYISLVKRIYYSIFFPLGQNFIGNYLPTIIEQELKEVSFLQDN